MDKEEHVALRLGGGVVHLHGLRAMQRDQRCFRRVSPWHNKRIQAWRGAALRLTRHLLPVTTRAPHCFAIAAVLSVLGPAPTIISRGGGSRHFRFLSVEAAGSGTRSTRPSRHVVGTGPVFLLGSDK